MSSSTRALSYKELVERECQQAINNMLETLPDYCRLFDEKRAGEDIAIRTRKENLRDITLFFRFIVTLPEFDQYEIKNFPVEQLENITILQLDSYMSWLKGTPDNNLSMEVSARKRNLTSVRALFSYLYTRNFINANPILKKELPRIKQKDPEQIIILEQYMRFPFFKSFDDAIEEANEKLEETMQNKKNVSARIQIGPAIATRDKLIVYLLIGTGIRISELCGMDINDFSPALNCINITRKGNHVDAVYLPDYVRTLLDDYIANWRDQFKPSPEHKNAIFLSEQHARITVRTVERMIKKHADLTLGANNKISPHKLRATFATEYYEQTHDIEGASHAVGHADISTTAKYYVRKSKDAKMKATELDFRIENN